MKKRLMMAMTTALAIGMLAGCGEKDTATTDTNASTPVATEASAPTEEAAPTEADTTAADVVTDVVEEIVYPGLNPELKELFANEPEAGKPVNISGNGFPKTFENYSFSGNVLVDEETGYVYAEDKNLAYFSDGEHETFGVVCAGEMTIGDKTYKSESSKEGIPDRVIIDLVTGEETHTYFTTSGTDTFKYVDNYGVFHENVPYVQGKYIHCFIELAKRCGVTVEAAQ